MESLHPLRRQGLRSKEIEQATLAKKHPENGRVPKLLHTEATPDPGEACIRNPSYRDLVCLQTRRKVNKKKKIQTNVMLKLTKLPKWGG